MEKTLKFERMKSPAPGDKPHRLTVRGIDKPSMLTVPGEEQGNPRGRTVEGAVTLRSLKLLHDNMTKLMSEMASLSSTLKAVETEVRNLKLAQ